EKKLLKEQPASEAGRKLAKRHEKALALSDADYRRVFTGEQCRRWDALRRDLVAVERSRPPSPPTALAITDKRPEPEPTWLLDRRASYAKRSPGRPAFLTVRAGPPAA